MKAKILIFCWLFVLGNLSCTQTRKPKVNEVYMLKKPRAYTIIKIHKVDKEKVWYITNDYEVSAVLYIDSINNENNYTDGTEVVSIKEFYQKDISILKH